MSQDSLFQASEVEVYAKCVQCGKDIKRGYYIGGNGPYGNDCYKKLGGKRSGRVRKKSLKRQVSKEQYCSMGVVKDCKNCALYEGCDADEKS